MADRWRGRVEILFRCKEYAVAEKGCLVSLRFWPRIPSCRRNIADTHAAIAFAKHEQNKSSFVEDANRCKQCDPGVAMVGIFLDQYSLFVFLLIVFFLVILGVHISY